MHISDNSDFQKYLEKRKEVEEFLVNVGADDNQRKKVEQYFSYNFLTRNRKQLIETSDLKDYLPYSLLKDVIYAASREILRPMFKDFNSENLIKELSFVLHNAIYMPGDYIIFKD